MSFYMRRLIARRILKTILKTECASSTRELEKDLAKTIKVTQMKKKNVLNEAQFFVNLTQAAELLKGDNLSKLTAEKLNFQTADSSSECSNIFKHVKQTTKLMEIILDQVQLNKMVLNMVSKQNERYGVETLSADCEKQTILVEYSSPNIAKPFHAGHMRSTILGNVLSNIYESVGHTVYRVNFLGDWGKQFGLLCYGYRKYGDEESLQNNAMKHLFEVYVKVNQDAEKEMKEGSTDGVLKSGQEIFKNMEAGDKDELSLWRRFRELSIAEYEKMYKRLNVKFTVYEGESMYSKHSILALIDRLREENHLQTENESGAQYIPVDSVEGTDKLIVMRRDGTTLYSTRDIAAALERQEKYKFDKMHYVVAKSQERHFQLLFAALRKLGCKWTESLDAHVKFGQITGMSTRRGNVILLEDILNEAKDRMTESMQNKETSKLLENPDEVADQLGVSALIIQDLKERKEKNYAFDWNKVLNPKSDSGVFLQYGHARLCSLIAKCSDIVMDDDVDIALLKEPEAVFLVQEILKYEDAVYFAIEELEPCRIVNYLFSLVRASNVALHNLNVKTAEEDVAKARLLMFKCTQTTLFNGLSLLGITPLTKI